MLSKLNIWNHNTVIPPKMFECVTENVYRSNIVTEENILFLQTIHLKTVVYIGDHPLDESVSLYFNSFGIQIVSLIQIVMNRSK